MFSNAYAPEHLIINADYGTTQQCTDNIKHAGSVFLGAWSPERFAHKLKKLLSVFPLPSLLNFFCSCGDYASGTYHTLPTYGFARQYSGVSVDTFVKYITAQHLSEAGLVGIGKSVRTLASVEGLDAHRMAVVVREEYIARRK